MNKGLWIISGWNKLFFWKIWAFDRLYFQINYSTSNIILHLVVSTVNLKIIFVKKQKQKRERRTQGRGATFIITLPFSHYRSIIRVRRVIRLMIRVRQVIRLNQKMEWFKFWMNNPPDFWRRDYPFQIACVQPPPPLRKFRRRGVCGEDATVHRLISDGWSISSSRVKTANNKIPVSSVFNDCEGLYGTTVCRCLVPRPHYSARLMRFRSRGPSEFATEMPWPRLRGKTPYRD